MKQLVSLFFLLLPIWPMAVLAQQQTLSGKVISSGDGKPLPGATVQLKNGNQNVVTDENGRFAISANGMDSLTLLVSFVGYKSREAGITLPYKGLLVLELTPATTQLEKVVVSTGYYQIPQERATGSFTHINEELLDRRIGTGIIDRLDGMAPGVLFNRANDGTVSGTAITVRGLSTLNPLVGQPLVVVDNFPYQGDISQINPADVESITVLKDAAAASIWGTRAGNGVVVITTKKGRYNQPTRVSFSANLTVTEKPDLFYRPTMSTSDFIDLERFLFGRGFYDWMLEDVRTRPVVTPVVELLAKQRNGELTAAEVESRLGVLRGRDVRRDLGEYVYRNAVNQQYAIGISGGGKNLGYRFSAGYDKNMHSLVGNSYDRLTLRAGNSINLAKGLKLRLGIAYTHSLKRNNNTGDIQPDGGRALYPYAQLADDWGNPMVLEKKYRLSYVDTAGGGRLLDWKYRPLEEIKLADNRSAMEHLAMNADVGYRLSPSIRAGLKYRFEKGSTEGRNHYSDKTFYTRDLINRFTQVDGGELTHIIPLGGILDRSHSEKLAHNLRGQVNYESQWGDKHKLNALLGTELRESRYTASSGRTYGYNDGLLTYANVDYVNEYPAYGGISYYPLSVPENKSFTGLTDRFVSFYANAAYTFKDRYTISGSARRDASNLFGTGTNDKWQPLWSAGLAWHLSDEPFYQWKALPYLKIRATYGYSGNVNNSIAAVTTIQHRPSRFNRVNGLSYAIVQNPPNANLRWEKVGTVNIGLDFSSRNGTLSGTLEYYRKKATDLIVYVPTDITIGFSGLNVNSAILNTHGWDISLKSRNIDGGIKWFTDFFLSINKNKVAKYLYKPLRPSNYVGSGSTLSPIEGKYAYPVVSYKWGGLDGSTGDPLGYVDGEPSTDYRKLTRDALYEDLVFHGPAKPQYFGAVRNTLAWKKWSISANITYRAGYYFRRNTIYYSNLINTGGSMHADYTERWKRPGDERNTDVPSMVYPADSRRSRFYGYSEVTVEKGDHVRLQDIALSYLPGDFGRLPFRRLRISVYARNLGIIWRANNLGLDPDHSFLPAPMSVSLGLKADF